MFGTLYLVGVQISFNQSRIQINPCINSALVSAHQITPSTRENDQKGSTMKKTQKGVENSAYWFIKSVEKNPNSNFSKDEPIGSFSPVQGEQNKTK